MCLTALAFSASGSKPVTSTVQTDTLDMTVARRYNLVVPSMFDSDPELNEVVTVATAPSLSLYKKFVVSYIAGFVVRMIRRQLRCPECLASLAVVNASVTFNEALQFVEFKDKGGLVKSSHSVLLVCQSTESCIQRMLNATGGALPQCADEIQSAISIAVLSDVGTRVFDDLTQHMFDSTPDGNHVFNLVKLICRNYTKIRFHSLAKTFTAEISGKKVRKQLGKLVLFKHQ